MLLHLVHPYKPIRQGFHLVILFTASELLLWLPMTVVKKKRKEEEGLFLQAVICPEILYEPRCLNEHCRLSLCSDPHYTDRTSDVFNTINHSGFPCSAPCAKSREGPGSVLTRPPIMLTCCCPLQVNWGEWFLWKLFFHKTIWYFMYFTKYFVIWYGIFFTLRFVQIKCLHILWSESLTCHINMHLSHSEYQFIFLRWLIFLLEWVPALDKDYVIHKICIEVGITVCCRNALATWEPDCSICVVFLLFRRNSQSFRVIKKTG